MLGVERQQPQHLVARGRGVGRLAGDDRQQRVPAQPHAGGIVRAALQVGVEDAVEHPRRVLGARQLAADPVQLVGDPGQHRLLLLLLLGGPGAAERQARHPRRRPLRQRRGRPGACPRPPRAPTCPWSRRLAGVDDHRTFAQRHAGQAAGHDVDVLAEDRERRRSTWRGASSAVRAGRRHRRELDELLRDPALRRALELLRLRGQLLLARARPDEDALAADWLVGLTTTSCRRPRTTHAARGRSSGRSGRSRAAASRPGSSGSSPARSGRSPCRRRHPCRRR